jgi:threonyl-tRNA synthetase
MGILLEQYNGHLPLWLSPIQVKIVTVNDHCIKFAEGIVDKLKESNIKVELDDRSESIGKKVRDAQLLKIPIIITVGEKEVKEKTIAVREEGKVSFGVDISKFIDEIAKKIKARC